MAYTTPAELKKELHAVREDRNNQTAEILDRLQDMMGSPVNSSGSSARLLTLAGSALFEELTANYGCSQPLAAHFVAAHVSTDNLRSIRTGREYRQDGPTPHGTEWCDTCTELDT